MDDRELLELAAKAAGIVGTYQRVHQTYGDQWVDGVQIADNPIFWNPLTDDGDALRLATTLRLEIRPCWLFVEVESGVSVEATRCVDTDDSRNAATRYAITRAAATLAKGEGKV